MFERFAEKSIKVIMLAQEEARRLGHSFIDTEQLLLGLIGEGEGVAAKVLKSMGINLIDVRIEVEKITGRGSGVTSLEIPFTPSSTRVLERSLEESCQFGHRYIDTEHLLLGLIQENKGVAVRVLEIMGVDLSQLRNQVIRQIGETTETLYEVEETEDIGERVAVSRLFQPYTQVTRQTDQATFEIEETDYTAELDQTVVIIPTRLEKQIKRLSVILAEAKKLIGEIEPILEYKLPTRSTDITDVINQLPNSPKENQPGIKELLTQLLVGIKENSDFNNEDKNEALEQVLVLAAVGQNPKKDSIKKSAKTALKILKATFAELPNNNDNVQKCRQILPAIARFF